MIPANNNLKYTIVGKAILFCAIITGLLKLSLIITSSIPGLPNNFLTSSIGPVLALLITYVFLKSDSRTFRSIGLRFEKPTIKKFCIGFLIGMLIMAVFIICFIYSIGLNMRLSKDANILPLILNALPTIILLAFMEEVIFRAYPLVILKNGPGNIPAVVITSILFGLYHVVFGWGMTGFLSTGIWGLAFGTLAIYSNGISMSTGFHAAGNFIQMALGSSGSSYNITEIVYKDGSPVKNYSDNQATIIATLILFLFIILCMKWLLPKKNDQ